MCEFKGISYDSLSEKEGELSLLMTEGEALGEDRAHNSVIMDLPRQAC